MALITDLDDLSQGGSTAVSDIVFGTPTGNQVTVTSAGSNLPTLADDAFFELRDHSDAVNNGLYRVNDATPASSSLDIEKVTGSNPIAATSEAVTILGSTATPKSVFYDAAARNVYLIEQGNLGADGITGQAFYSHAVEAWKDDDFLMPAAPFPMTCIDADAGKYIVGQDPSGNYNGWNLADNSTFSIRTTNLVRSFGWSAYDDAGVLRDVWFCVKTLGAFEDDANDTAYGQFGTDTAVDDTFDMTFAGPVNEAVKCYDATVTRAVATPSGYAFVDGGGSDDSITRASGSFVTDGYKVGGKVVVANATTGANDGSYTLTSVAALTLGVPTASLTADTDDNTATLDVDNRAAFTLRLRVRDGDANGKTYDQSDLAEIDETTLGNRLFSFGLANSTDLNISETDANIDANTPYTGMSVTYYATPQSLGGGGVLVGGPYDFGIVVTANDGTAQEVYEFVQRQLRKSTDIDAGAGTVIGRPADGLCRFLGEAFQLGSVDGGLTVPTNPHGGGSGVFVSGLNAASLNTTTVRDNTSTVRSFPESVTVTLDFNQTLIDDTVAEYTLYFDRTIRNTVSDLVINAGTGANGTFTSAGANLPASLDGGAGAYVRVSGLTGVDEPMNGVYQVTALTSTSSWDVTRYDSATVVTTTSASLSVDEHAINTPDAIIVKDNVAADVTGLASADYAFAFDYSNNVQGGRTGGTDAQVVARAIGQATAQFTQSAVRTIESGVPLTIAVTSSIERNFDNPA